MTSADSSVNSTSRSSGSTSSYDRRSFWSGYSKRHANCCANTFTWSAFALALAFCESTTAVTTPIAITSRAGTAVHAISRPVCPWMGGPSPSSSGWALNAKIEYTLTAATRAKMAMQITVVNQ